MSSAGTDDGVNMTVCDAANNCCTSVLDNPGDDWKKGAVDTFSDQTTLGDCSSMRLKGQLTATLSKDGSDGWQVIFDRDDDNLNMQPKVC